MATSDLAGELLLVAVGGVIGIVGTLLANRQAARLERGRRKADALNGLLDAATQFVQQPLDASLAFLRARAGYLAWPHASPELQQKMLAFDAAATAIHLMVPRDQHGNVVPEVMQADFLSTESANHGRLISTLNELRDGIHGELAADK